MPILPGRHKGEVFYCDRSHYRTDVCTLKGDVRMLGGLNTFVLYTSVRNLSGREEKIRPYTRKWEESTMKIIHEVTLKSLIGPADAGAACDVNHTVPAIVFTTGGYTGNVYHEFNDGLIPLYITSQHLKGEVVYVIVEFHDWWWTRYRQVIRQLSNHYVIDSENDKRVHCFPEVTIGVHIHAELAVEPTLMPGGESLRSFRNVLDQAYSGDDEGKVVEPVSDKLKLVIIVRENKRIFLNLNQLKLAAEQVGFAVTLLVPNATMELNSIYQVLNASDVMLGVHGAAMTHLLFMRPGSVFIQIIPLGTDWAAWNYYGEPATKLGLHYIPYKIQPAESSLSDKYEKNDPVLKDPQSVAAQGWSAVKEIYLNQDVRPSVLKMKYLLEKARMYRISHGRS